MPFTLSPPAKFEGFDDEGDPLVGGFLYTYAAGTIMLQATFADANGVANTNPVVLDSAGRATVYVGALSYKFVLKTSADVQVWSQDNVEDPALTAVSGDIVGTSDTQTLSNKTLLTPIITGGVATGLTLHSPIINTATSTGGTFTTPTIASPTFSTKVDLTKRWNYAKGANVTSAGTLTLGDDGNVFAITGGAAINNITFTNWQAGSPVFLIFTATETVMHNQAGTATAAPILLSDGLNLLTSPPTTLCVIFDGTNWQQFGPASVNHA